jgi:Zn-dependent metalloprotease
MKKLITFCILVLIASTSLAQNEVHGLERLSNTRPLFCEALSSIAEPASSPTWINFTKPITFTKATDIQQILQPLSLSINANLKYINTIKDEDLGKEVFIYNQTYKGYSIADAQLNVHAKNKNLQKANGILVRGELNYNNTFFSLATITQTAYQLFGTNRCYQVGTTDTVWMRADFGNKSKDNAAYILCYCIQLKNIDKGYKYYFNCSNGQLLNKIPTVMNCNSTTHSTVWNSNKTIYTQYFSFLSLYRMINDCNPTKLEVLERRDSNTYVSIYSSTNTNGSYPIGYASALYYGTATYNYFKQIHSREGQRGDSTKMVFLIDKDTSYCPGCTGANAFAGDTMSFGNNFTTGTYDDWYSLDVVGHEAAHTVTYTNGSGGLDYVAESGALNESFSDIFGNIIEMYIEGYNDTSKVWQMREDAANLFGGTSLFIRDMRNPNIKNDPATYQQSPYWVSTTGTCNKGNDQCGVHTNSGVQNYFFYLLTTGSSGLGNATFAGLGIAKARAIAYKTLTGGYLTSTSDYYDARNAWVNAAVDLYGNCSIEAITVGKAWEMVGLESYYYYYLSNHCGSYGSAVNDISSNHPINLSYSGCGGNATILGTGNSVTFNGASHVDIYPGFNTNSGAFFNAKTNECFYSNY